jgi:hypothetical protein
MNSTMESFLLPLAEIYFQKTFGREPIVRKSGLVVFTSDFPMKRNEK